MPTAAITGQTTFGANTSGTTTQLDNNFLLCLNALNSFNQYSNYLVDSGAANAYVVTAPASTTATLAAGLPVQFNATNANTGASTLNVNGTGVKNILNPNGSALRAGQIPAGSIISVIYDGTQYVMLARANTSQLQTLSTTLTTVAAGVTNYMGSNNVSATEAFVAILVPFACTLRNLRVNSQVVPGVGQTYVYTLRKTGVDTAVTCTTSGNASSGSSDLTHSVSFAAGDSFDVSVVTSGGAGVGIHWGTIELQVTG